MPSVLQINKSKTQGRLSPEYLAEVSWTILHFTAHTDACIPTNVFRGRLIEKPQQGNSHRPQEGLKLAWVLQI